MYFDEVGCTGSAYDRTLCRSCTDLQRNAEGAHSAANDRQLLCQFLNLYVQPLSPVFFLLDLLLQLLTLFSIPTNRQEAVD
jgi:hypothetical protein